MLTDSKAGYVSRFLGFGSLPRCRRAVGVPCLLGGSDLDPHPKFVNSAYGKI